MTDPIAEAAAAQQAANEPSLLEKAQETIHQLEEKLEHMIHPVEDAAPSSTEPAQEVAASTAGSATSLSASPVSPESATLAPSASVEVRKQLQAIRSHLSLMGFEQSSVAVIHGAMDEIEKLL